MKKKILISSIVLLLMVCFLPVVTVNAEQEALSPWLLPLEDENKWELEGGVTVSTQQISGKLHGIESEGYDNHTFQWMVLPSEAEAIKVVTWSTGSDDAWTKVTCRDTALDFEAKNPGWIVVGAVNGDFFDINATGQPTNYFVQDGEVLRAVGNSAPNRGVVGFGSTQKDHVAALQSEVTKSSMPYLKVYDGNTIESKTLLKVTNNKPSETGINLYTTALSQEVDLTGYKVYLCDYEFNRYTSASSLYVRGAVNRVETIGKINSVPTGKFYLACKDGSLDNLIATGDRVKCEYELGGALSGYNNVIGYIWELMENGKPKFQGCKNSTDLAEKGYPTDTYITTANPFMAIGFKEDGSLVMLTTNGRGTAADCNVSPTLFECAEMLRVLGCKEAYSFDGGGSVTMLARINGQLEVMNTPSDGNERPLGNAILLVMPDPRISCTATTNDSITFTQAENLTKGEFQDITFSFAGKSFKMENGKITLEDLRKNTTYDITCSYKYVEGDSVRNAVQKFSITTDANRTPEAKLTLKSTSISDAVLTYKISDRDETIENAHIEVNGKEIALHDLAGDITVSELLPNTSYSAKIVVEYNSGNGIKEVAAEPLEFTTKANEPIEQTCEENPNQEKCKTEPPVEKTCEEDPTQEKCKTEPPVEKTCEEDPTQEKCQVEPKPGKGCKKKSAAYVAIMISAVSALALVFRRRK